MMKKLFALLLAGLLVLSAAGCAPAKEPAASPQGTPKLSDPAEQESTGEVILEVPMEDFLDTAETLAPYETPQYRDDGLEYAVFPMEYLGISQTAGEGTHYYNQAVDFMGRDVGIDAFYAPFTLRIVRIQKGYNIVWAQSVEKVHLANGDLDYVTLMLEHDDNIDNLYVGQLIRQGEVFYDEGTAGNASGNHVHCEFGLGEYVDEGCFHSADDRVCINNGIPANEVLFLTASTLYNGDADGGFVWRKLPETTEEIVANGWHCQGQGHLPDEISILREPSCTADGANRYTCSLCHNTVTESIPALGHTPQVNRVVDGSSAALRFLSCTTCGSRWLEPEWAEIQTEFTDVSADDAPYIAYACSHGLMAGVTETEFFPEGYLSRIELLTILYKLGGGSGEYDFTYTDVRDDDPNRDVIGWATAMGLAEATSDKKFTPETAVTREDAIRMVLRYTELYGLDTSEADGSDPSAWAVSAGLYASTDNLHCAVTRAEGARLLSTMLLLDEIGETEPAGAP